MPETALSKNQRVTRIHPDHPSPTAIQRAADLIKTRGVVIFPTQCLYGLAADALDSRAIKKIFHIKHRPENNPLLVLIHHYNDLAQITAKIPESAQVLMKAFWPGSLTLIFEAAPGVCDLLTAGTGKIGVRIPAHPVARALVAAAGRPITGTSANISGSPGCSDVKDLPRHLIHAVDMVLDAGPLKGGPGSTILDITRDTPRILRQGAVPVDAIWQVLGNSRPGGKK